MLIVPVLVTPLMLATQPVSVQIPDDWSYNHRAQVGVYKGEKANALKLAGTSTTSYSGGTDRAHTYHDND